MELMNACRKKCSLALELIRSGANVNVTYEGKHYDKSPLRIVMDRISRPQTPKKRKKLLRLIYAILEAGACPSYYMGNTHTIRHSPFLHAVILGDIDLIKMMVHFGTMANFNFSTFRPLYPLNVAIDSGNIKVIKLLLALDASVLNESTMMHIIYNQHYTYETLEVLLAVYTNYIREKGIESHLTNFRLDTIPKPYAIRTLMIAFPNWSICRGGLNSLVRFIELTGNYIISGYDHSDIYFRYKSDPLPSLFELIQFELRMQDLRGEIEELKEEWVMNYYAIQELME